MPNLHHQDSYALEVIAAILSGGRSSRFYQNLVREKQLALSADADNALVSKDPNLFTISAQPFPGKEVGELEKALGLEIERLQKEGWGSPNWRKPRINWKPLLFMARILFSLRL